MHSLFGFSGRIGRLAFLGYSILVWVIACVLIGIAFSMIWSLHPNAGTLISAYELMASTAVGLIWTSWALWFKRLHDMGLSGWYAIAMTLGGIIGNIMSSSYDPAVAMVGVLLAVIAVIAELACLFVPGTKGLNQFGPPPGSYKLTAATA